MYESRMYECKEDARRSSGSWEYGIVKMAGRGIRDECDCINDESGSRKWTIKKARIAHEEERKLHIKKRNMRHIEIRKRIVQSE